MGASSATASRTRRATMPLGSPGAMTPNSSGPMRATVSTRRTWSARVAATLRRTSSPTPAPCCSLMPARSSTSKIATARAVPRRVRARQLQLQHLPERVPVGEAGQRVGPGQPLLVGDALRGRAPRAAPGGWPPRPGPRSPGRSRRWASSAAHEPSPADRPGPAGPRPWRPSGPRARGARWHPAARPRRHRRRAPAGRATSQVGARSRMTLATGLVAARRRRRGSPSACVSTPVSASYSRIDAARAAARGACLVALSWRGWCRGRPPAPGRGLHRTGWGPSGRGR